MLRLHSFVHKGNSLRMQHSEKHKNKKTHIAHNILALTAKTGKSLNAEIYAALHS